MGKASCSDVLKYDAMCLITDPDCPAHQMRQKASRKMATIGAQSKFRRASRTTDHWHRLAPLSTPLLLKTFPHAF